MKISPKTKILELTKEFPFLVDFLADYHPSFAGLRNPVLRNTLGRVANIAKVAAMGETPLDELLMALKQRIEDEGAGPVELDIADMPPSDAERQEALKVIIRDLHAGTSVAELKTRFAELIEDVGPAEIAAMEQALIDEGMPQEEIQRLCDVHVEVFKETLDQIELDALPTGHPVRTFMDENVALGKVCEALNKLLTGLCEPAKTGRLELVREELTSLLDKLGEVNTHYIRKENQLFPYLEKNGISGPPQVMWGIHDQVRAELKDVRKALGNSDADELAKLGQALTTKVVDMIYKEDNILYPMSQSVLSEAEWVEIRAGETDIGYALIEPGDEWQPSGEGHGGDDALKRASITSALPMQTGLLSLEQINLLFTHLPIEVSFTDEKDEVRFFSDTDDRVFPRSSGVIGRKVENCHPPKSMGQVREILNSFRSGKQSKAEFWIELGGKFLHICYFAVRDSDGNFRGTLETIQDATHVRSLTGERRLVEWGDK